VVNDRADIAMLAGADGVHLGQEDLPAETVRGLIGKNKIIGLSTHNLKEAIEADMLAKKGVIDYISYGPVFPTKTKVDARPTVGIEGLREAKKFVTAPLVAIGGITEETLFETILAGADAVSIVSDILTAKDIRSKVERLTRAF
jgi:thiamine-phosphate pyrophosphorylase